MTSETASYREYVAARLDGFRRTAYLVCGDWHTADDLVSVTNLFRHWRRVSKMDNIDAYVRKSLLRAWLNERRRLGARSRRNRHRPAEPVRAAAPQPDRPAAAPAVVRYGPGNGRPSRSVRRSLA